MFVGVDIGGTFTDFVLSRDGGLWIHKIPSTPAAPAQAMVAGLAALSGGDLAAVRRVSHGSTVATNAILERKGAPTALITTAGFGDLLAIGRQNRPHLYALQPQLPPPLIPRRWCYEVPERLDHAGNVLTPLDLPALDRVLDDLATQDIESVAVCFLYSYRNPVHEEMVRARILERQLLPPSQIALSCEVLPEFREVERASTVALEAYVRPVMSRYLQRLEMELPPRCTLRIMKSDGGVMSARRARQQAIHTALSGPAAGVIGAFYLAEQAGHRQIITIDMGGTSTDVSLCPGRLTRSAQSEIDGLPLRTRLLDIATIGAGGGSIARVDAGGALRVGPESAGADPGPVAYGLGGQQVTVTDANVLLGRLDPAHFLGGAMALHLPPARAALAHLAQEMGCSVEEAALGVVDVANANIDRAVRRVSVARGHDPRDFTLFPFGGAGPMHACEVAERLDIPRILVPRYPGVLCAFGLLMADVVLDYGRSVLHTIEPATEAELQARLQQRIEQMIAQAQDDLLAEGIDREHMAFAGLADMRYQGQSYELTIPFSQQLRADFCARHAASYGHEMPERAVEVVNLRLEATGWVEKPTLVPQETVESDGAVARLGDRRAVCGDGEQRLALYDRQRLQPGARFSGPALVLQMDSTLFIPPRWAASVDGYHNVILERRT
ncbi:MAG: hydantoinase/oxoprolinase family protein [Anaerolineae bacterium]|nr:hydantoinase/oxoprolinase family protein [Anaerolineae bacterium]